VHIQLCSCLHDQPPSATDVTPVAFHQGLLQEEPQFKSEVKSDVCCGAGPDLIGSTGSEQVSCTCTAWRPASAGACSRPRDSLQAAGSWLSV